MKQLIIILLLFAFVKSASAQVANDYVLFPGASDLLPAGEQLKLFIQWYDVDGIPHEGVSAFIKAQTPEWFIDGKPVSSHDASMGHLSVDLTFEHAVYAAPATLPKVNPINISVRFHPTDTSKAMVT